MKLRTIFLAVLVLTILTGCTTNETTTVVEDTLESSGIEEVADKVIEEESKELEIGTPREAFQGYRQALVDKDFDEYLKHISVEAFEANNAALGIEVTEADFIEAAELIAMFQTPYENVIVEEEVINGNSAVWTVSDKGDPNASGTIEFIKEDNGWKLLREEWETFIS